MALFKPQMKIERGFERQFNSVIAEINKIVDQYYDPSKPDEIQKLIQALTAYSKQLAPWAKSIAENYIQQISTSNLNEWMALSEKIGRELKRSYGSRNDPVFKAARKLQNAQVQLIVTIPQRMAARAQEFSRQYAAGGLRASGLAANILKTNQVAAFVAKRIARTEIAKANATLTRARAESVGIEYYEWVSAGDQIVRESHQRMNGKICRFDKPPYVQGEGYHHPGEIYNCRCYARPIIKPSELDAIKERGGE